MIKFKYFRAPNNFAFRLETPLNCSICQQVGLWFDSGFTGDVDIECVCDRCLSEGALKPLGVETNEAFEGSPEEIDTIIYRTPPLPTWQDTYWPYINGQYGIFECIASKANFATKEEFKECFSKSDIETTDFDWLWEILPEKLITNIQNSNFTVSVYLFTFNGKKFCIWDAN